MKKILIVTTVNGFGEANVPVNFARQLNPSRFSVRFIAPKVAAKFIEPLFPVLTLGAHKDRNNSNIYQLLLKDPPDLIVFSTYQVMELASYMELAILEANPIPKATFNLDYFDLTRTEDIEMPKHKVKYLNPIPLKYAVIRSVPIKGYVTPHRVYTYSFYDTSKVLPDSRRARIRSDLGCAEPEKLVVFPSPQWLYFYCLLHGLKHIYYEIGSLILESLDKAGEPVLLYHIAEYPLIREEASSDMVRVINVKSIPIERYEAIAGSADLIVSTNSTSGAVFLGIFSLVPFLSFINSLTREAFDRSALHRKERFEPVKGLDPIYPWKVFPLGKVEVARAHWSDKVLKQTFCETEIFDTEFSGQLIRKLLGRGEPYAQLITAQKRAQEYLLSLPSPEDICNSIIKEWNTAHGT